MKHFATSPSLPHPPQRWWRWRREAAAAAGRTAGGKLQNPSMFLITWRGPVERAKEPAGGGS